MKREEIIKIIEHWQIDTNYYLVGYEKEFIIEIVKRCLEKTKK